MKFFKSMSIYFAGGVINAAIPFLLLPFFTRYLSRSDFGMLALVQTFAAFLFPLVIVGIHASINMQYYRLPDRAEFGSYLRSALAIPLVATLVVAALVRLLGGHLARFSGVSLGWMEVCVLLAALQVMPQVILFLCQAAQKPLQYAYFQIGLTFLNFSLSLVLIGAANMNWEGRMYGLLGTNLVFTVIGLVWLSRQGYLACPFEGRYFREAFRFGIFLIPHEIGGIAIQMSNRLVINNLAGVDMLGIYSAAYQVASIVSFIALAYNQAWIPYLFGRLGRDGGSGQRNLVRMSYGFMAAFAILALVLKGCVRFLFHLFISRKFADAEPLVFWLGLSFAFMGMYYVVVNYIIYEKKTHLLAYITVACGLASIGLTWLFTLRGGVLGAVKAQAIGNLIFFLATWAFAARVHPMPWLRAFQRAR